MSRKAWSASRISRWTGVSLPRVPVAAPWTPAGGSPLFCGRTWSCVDGTADGREDFAAVGFAASVGPTYQQPDDGSGAVPLFRHEERSSGGND
jgi:hypothetical protein